MPIQLGLASSHAPSLFSSTFDGWERTYQRMKRDRVQPHETEAIETKEEIERRVPRIKAAFETLKQQMADYAPDTLIVVMGDQREWFDASNIPNIAIYTGEADVWGVHNTGAADEDPPAVPTEDYDRFRLDVKTDRDLAEKILKGLIDRGFDVARSDKMNPQSNPKRGVPHGLMNPMQHVLHRLDLPVVMVWVNVDDGPPAILNGERTLELGRAIADICEGSAKRIAIYGSGGMSHNPGGPRSGWVDEPLDNWFMDQITDGKADNLKALFSFRSENLVGGTGELHCWMVVAGAMDQVKAGHQAVKVDYFAARKVTTGSGWAYWPQVQEPAAVR
jgi:aromatic ring-opening dioxygenase catalytic subunit (LigB family)